VNGGAGPDTIIDPENLAGTWQVHLAQGANTIQVNATSANLAAGTIDAVGGTAALVINAGGASNTTMSYAEYQLFNANPVSGITTTGGSTFGNTTITFSNNVTGSDLLNINVGNWIFAAGNDTFTLHVDTILGAQNINIASGGSDTIKLQGGGFNFFSGNVVGASSNDTLVFTGGTLNISGMNGGGAIGVGTFDFNNTSQSSVMTLAQYLSPAFTNTGGTQTITLTTSGTAAGNAGIENYFLANGNDTFTVSPDNGSLVGGHQNVDISSGGTDTIVYGTGTFTGNLTGAGADDTVLFTGNVSNISGVNGGAATGAASAAFNNGSVSATMTLAQHNGFTQPFLQTGGTQTITLTTSGTATGDAGIENYVLASGNDIFTVAVDSGAFHQNVDITSGGADIIIYGTGTFTGNLTGASANDTVRFTGNVSNIAGVNGGAATGAGSADFNNGAVSATMTLAQHNGFNQPFLQTTGIQTITLTTSGTATGDGGIENYFLASGNDVFTVAADSGAFKQNVDISSGGADIVVYGTGTFTGNLVGAGADDTVRFTGNVSNISGVNGGAATGAGSADFNNGSVSATMTLAQHNGFAQPFLQTGGTQTITLTTSGTATGDAGIENYVLASGADTFTVAADNGALVGGHQNVNIASGGADTIIYGTGTFTGNLVGAGADDTAKFTGNANIAGVNGGAATGANFADFNNNSETVTMTVAQHEGFSKDFLNTGGTQTIVLTTSGTAVGDKGIENYILASGNDLFTVAADNGGLVGGHQNVNVASGGADIIVFGTGKFTGNLVGAGADDTVRFTGNVSDISGVNGGLATGAKFADFNNGAVSATMTMAQHNGFSQPFLQTTGVQTITLTTDGTTTGDIGIENYFLGADGSNSNVFTVGNITQNVTGDQVKNENDIVIDHFGGLSGVLKGGANTATGDTLILDAPNTVLAAGSGQFENLTLVQTNSNVSMTALTHVDFTGVINAPGTNTMTLTTTTSTVPGGIVTALAGFENYTLAGGATGTNELVLTNSQTGTITGGNRADTVDATGAQVLALVAINLDGSPLGILTPDVLNITTDAGGINLNTKTSGVDVFNLQAGSTSNVIGTNDIGVIVNSVGNTIFTMGAGAGQAYNGGVLLLSGVDQVTFGLGNAVSIFTGGGDDIVKSTVGANFNLVILDGGAGFDKLQLAGNDDISGATISNFEELDLATNATVTMTNAQHNVYAQGFITGAGIETIKITDAFTGFTQVQIENYNLAAGAADHTYTIAGSGQTVTDLDAAGTNTANINGGLSNVTLVATAGANYVVNDLSGGTNLKVTLDGGADTVSLAGGHTGVNIDLGLGNDTLNVTGVVTGTLNGNAPVVATGDTLHLNDTADLLGATVSNFETLDFASGASVKMTATTWDQFVATTGNATANHAVTGAAGVETVTLDSTSANTTAFTNVVNLGVPEVEKYILTNAGADTFTVNTINAATKVSVDLVGGGHDTVKLNDGNASASFGNDIRADVFNFTSGGGGEADFLNVQHQGTSISSGGFQTVTFATNVGAANNAINVNPVLIGDIGSVWSQATARTYLDLAVNNIAVGDYTFVAYNGADADVMAVHIVTANTWANANIDLVGVLHGVGSNSMLASNFA
ncbi:MAG: hypothetical protein U1E23_10655, partial [Reyranellaceae bacterium]